MGATRPFVAHGGALLDLAELRGVGATLQMGQATSVLVEVNDAAQILVIGYRFTTDGTTVGTTLEAAYLLSPVAPTVSLASTPSTAPVRAPVTLTWNAVNANNCIASGGVSGDGWAGPRPDSGQITVTTNVVGTAQYAMTCTAGPLSGEADMSVLYTAAPPAVRLTATPLQTQVRKAVTLAWSSEGADSCVATGGRPGDGWTGTLATIGQKTISGDTPGTVEYGVRCTAGGLSSDDAASVTYTKKSGGGGGLDFLAVLMLGLGLTRRTAT
jgi:hypothetical protein